MTITPTKAILFFFGCSEVNSTWLITSELPNQRAGKVLFTCLVYTKDCYIITKSMHVLWLVNQLWVIVPVNPRKIRASSELLYKSNRPQVSMVYRLINHLRCWQNTRRIRKSLACGSWFANSSRVLPTVRSGCVSQGLGTTEFHVFDWLKSLLKAVQILPSRPVTFCAEKDAN